MRLKRKHLAAIGFVIFAVLAQLVGAVAQTATDPRVADLVKAGKIRIGVFPSFQYSKTATGQPQGLAIGISRALSQRLGLGEVVTVEHPTPPKVIECVKAGECDFGFMLIDPPEQPRLISRPRLCDPISRIYCRQTPHFKPLLMLIVLGFE